MSAQRSIRSIIVYNEFKSVISQRVVVEKLLPIRKLGTHEITAAEEMTEEQKEAAAQGCRDVRRLDLRARRDESSSRKPRSSERLMSTTSSTSLRIGCFVT